MDVILAIGVNGVIGAIVMCIAVVAWEPGNDPYHPWDWYTYLHLVVFNGTYGKCR